MRGVVLAVLCTLLACDMPEVRYPIGIPGSCIEWADMPITVAIDYEARAYTTDVYLAMAAWNDALGQMAFVLVNDKSSARVLVVIGHDLGEGILGRAHGLCQIGPPTKVRLKPGMDMSWATPTATHELGHVLGLISHSEDMGSIMFERLVVAGQSIKSEDVARTFRIRE